MLIHTSL